MSNRRICVVSFVILYEIVYVTYGETLWSLRRWYDDFKCEVEGIFKNGQKRLNGNRAFKS